MMSERAVVRWGGPGSKKSTKVSGVIIRDAQLKPAPKTYMYRIAGGLPLSPTGPGESAETWLEAKIPGMSLSVGCFEGVGAADMI